MSDIHVTYQWVQSAEGDCAELVRKEAVVGSVHGSGGVVYLDHLEDLRHLDVRELRMEDNHLQDLSPLSHIGRLEILRLAGNKITDVTPLATLGNLRILDLGRNSRLESVAPLVALPFLEELSLYETGVYDLEPIAGLTSLKKLNISNTQISDLAPLTTMRSLREIQLFGFGEVERGTDDWNILVDLLVRGVRVDAHGVGKMMSAASQLREQRKNRRS